MSAPRSCLSNPNRDERKQGDDIGDKLQELRRKARHLWQADRQGGGDAEQESNRGGPERIAVGEEYRRQRDEAAFVGHLLGEQRNVAEREIGAGQPAKEAG